MTNPKPKQPQPRRRPSKNTYTTKSGNTIKLHHSLSERIRERRDAKARRRAAYLSRMPKERWKRILFRLKPRELARYWFSRDGAIMALKLTGIGIVVMFVLVVGMFAYFRKNLPDLKNISGTNIGGSITYYDRTGTKVLFQDYDSDKRIPVPANQISKYMNQATVATEDRGFYSEGAFNIKGILRAAVNDVFGGGGGGLQGGSTITQQLVKLNEGWTAQRTFTHKIEELILAVDLSREYSKAEILTGYENTAPYGNIEYGVQAAAQDYFGVNASQLTLAQAAMLAAIPQDPPYYSPYSSPKYNPAISVDNFDETALINRQHYVLDQMVKSGYITQTDADAAKKVDVLSQIHPLTSKYDGIQYPYYVLAAKQQLEQKYGASVVNRGGWKVVTALDTNLQDEADRDVANNYTNIKRYNASQEAMVGEDIKTGQIVMLVGGVNFQDPKVGQINYATSLTSPGSSFKPMDYAAMVNYTTNTGAGSVLYDGTPDGQPEALPGYPCTDKTRPTTTSVGGNCLWDYDYYFPGAESLRYALPGSRNVPAVKAMLTVGTDKVIQMADAMMAVPNAYQCYADAELTQPDACYGASAIGDGAFLSIANEVNYDASLARLGQAIPTTYILKITDASNNTLYQWTQPKPTQVIRPDAAYIINNILSDPNTTYLQPRQKFQNWNGWNISVKTGTEFYNHHGLMTAWSTQYAVVSWVGTDTDTINMTAGHMEDVTEPLTRTWIQYALNSTHLTKATDKTWQQPSDIQTLPGYIQTRAPAVSSGAVLTGKSTDIFPSWYVPKSGSGNSSAKYDIVSGDVATSCTPALATQSKTTTNASQFSADIFYNASGATANSSTPDTLHSCSDTKPSISVTASSCTGPNDCDFTVTITQGNNHPLSGGSYTASPASTLSLLVNNNVLTTVPIPADQTASWTYTFANVNVPNGQSVSAHVVDSVLYDATASPTPDAAPFQ